MIRLHDILMLDFAYLETFTKRFDTSWGCIFCNETQPLYYDANHAHISEPHPDPQSVIDEVTHFYQSRKIIPRFYLYNIDDLQHFISKLKLNHFMYEEFVHPVQLWNNKVIDFVKNNRVTIEKVTEINYQEALKIEGSIKEFGGKEAVEKVFEEQYNHPSFTHFLLRYDSIACSIACIFEDGKHAQMENVATLEEYRGKGLIGAMIQFIQKEIVKRGINHLWVFPINESVEKVYLKYGFQTVEKIKTGHAFLSGKSIKEIQG